MARRQQHQHGFPFSMNSLSLQEHPFPRSFSHLEEDDNGGGYLPYEFDQPYMPPRHGHPSQNSQNHQQGAYTSPLYGDSSQSSFTESPHQSLPARGYSQQSAYDLYPSQYEQITLPAANNHQHNVYEQGRPAPAENQWSQEQAMYQEYSQQQVPQRSQQFQASSSTRQTAHHQYAYYPQQANEQRNVPYHQPMTVDPGHLSMPLALPPTQYGSDPSAADEYLREQLGLPLGMPVNLNALSAPPPNERPTHALPVLIKLAINGSEQRQLTLQGICDAIKGRFEWYRNHNNDQAWKNSIRHNLSLNKVFIKVARPITEPGKGNYWTLDISRGEGYKRDRKRKAKTRAGSSSTQGDTDEDASSPEPDQHSTRPHRSNSYNSPYAAQIAYPGPPAPFSAPASYAESHVVQPNTRSVQRMRDDQARSHRH